VARWPRALGRVAAGWGAGTARRSARIARRAAVTAAVAAAVAAALVVLDALLLEDDDRSDGGR
jgi:hypothetical protein